MTDIAAIAKGLTKAQREALCAMPEAGCEFIPRDFVRQTPTWANLKSHLLIRPVRNEDWGYTALSIVTPLGLAVRQHLQEQE